MIEYSAAHAHAKPWAWHPAAGDAIDFAAGYSGMELKREGIDLGGERLLTKPFTTLELSRRSEPPCTPGKAREAPKERAGSGASRPTKESA